jgi:hypothetical protein
MSEVPIVTAPAIEAATIGDSLRLIRDMAGRHNQNDVYTAGGQGDWAVGSQET